jgi:hypothetical protein
MAPGGVEPPQTQDEALLQAYTGGCEHRVRIAASELVAAPVGKSVVQVCVGNAMPIDARRKAQR